MNLIRFIAVLLMSLTALAARANINENLALVSGGAANSWAFSGPIEGNMTTTLSFAPLNNASSLYTVIVDLNISGLTDEQLPVLNSAKLDGASMSFGSIAGATATFTFQGLLAGASHALVFDFTHQSFATIGARISVASEAPIQAPTPVPEPESWALMLGGLGVLSQAARKHRAAQAA